MIALYTQGKERLGLLTQRKGLHIKRSLAMDERTLYFQYDMNGPLAAQIGPECYIRTKDDEFVVKEVKGSNDGRWLEVTAVMNIEEVESCTFPKGVYYQEKTAQEVMDAVLVGSGWSFSNNVADPEKVRTIQKEDACNAWDIAKQVCATYGCEIIVNTRIKHISAVPKRGQDLDVVLMEGISLQQLEFTRDSYDFYTQIVPVGKDGLTLMDDPDDPVEYLSNHSYSPKAVRRIWKDERYTNVKSLREDALAKLKDACRPISIYRAKVRELCKGMTEHPEYFAFGLGDSLILVSKRAHVRERQRVVVLDEYEDRRLNTVEISSASISFAELQNSKQAASDNMIALSTRLITNLRKDVTQILK